MTLMAVFWILIPLFIGTRVAAVERRNQSCAVKRPEGEPNLHETRAF